MSTFKDLWEEDEEFLWEMSNLLGRETNLPLSLYFSPQPNNHKIRPIRFKVDQNPNSYKPKNTTMDYLIYNDGDTDNLTIKSVDTKHLNSRELRKLIPFIKKHIACIRKLYDMEISHNEFSTAVLSDKCDSL